LQGIQIERVERAAGGLVIEARARAAGVACPGCGTESVRVHGRYQRRVRDTALAGVPVVVRLQIRRFVYGQDSCPCRTFAEQIGGLTTPYGRHSPPLRSALTTIAVVLAGRPGARSPARWAWWSGGTRC
jgi:hypothetical protein